MGQEIIKGKLKAFVGVFTYDMAVAGALAITGVGFQPKKLDFVALKNTSTQITWGKSDGVNNECVCDDDVLNRFAYFADRIIKLMASSSIRAEATVQSMDTDGFTINRIKAGLPTGTATVIFGAVG